MGAASCTPVPSGLGAGEWTASHPSPDLVVTLGTRLLRNRVPQPLQRELGDRSREGGAQSAARLMLVVALGGFLFWGRIVSHVRIVDLDRFFTWCLIAARWWPPLPFARLLLGAMPFWPFRSIPTLVHGAHIGSPICSLEAADSLRSVASPAVADRSTLPNRNYVPTRPTRAVASQRTDCSMTSAAPPAPGLG
jgi:hypothetical protein